MGAKTLSVRLEGDRQVAKWLQLDHLNRFLYELESNNKQRLEIVSSRRNFFTQDGQFLGEMRAQTVFGATTVVIIGASGKEEKAVKQPIPIQTDQIVPCFIVTGSTRFSTEIVGYIACLSGTFKPPYKWFPKTAEDVQLSQFLASGYDGYSAEDSLPNSKMLSSVDTDVLLYLRPSGVAPDTDRYTANDGSTSGGSPEVLGAVQFTELYQDFVSEVYTTAYARNSINTETVYTFDRFFDSEPIGVYRLTQGLSGTRTVFLGSCYAFASSPAVYPDALQEVLECQAQGFDQQYYNLFDNGIGRSEVSTARIESSELLDSLAEEGVRLDGSLDLSLQLIFFVVSASTSTITIADHIPTTPDESPVFDSSFTPSVTTTSTYETYLIASLDNGVQYNVNDELGWGSDYGYSGIAYGYNLAYDKRQDSSRAIAVVKAGPDVSGNVTYESMGCVYIGPNSSEISGSVAFELINDNFDRYAVPPIPLPDSVSGKIRGHAFFGLIRTQKILTET